MAGREEEKRSREKEGTGKMTVEEAGHLGGQRVRELVQEGKELEREEGKEPETERSAKPRTGERGSEEESRR